ncbi:MAG: DUF2953 domain-containing protein [Clostridia bacterium]|nr:DUF2953 domain-containing protein [Clostridia bacterium]
MGAGWIVLIVFGSLALLILLLLLSRVHLRIFADETRSGLVLSWFVIRKKMKIEDASDLFEGHRKKKPEKPEKKAPVETPEEEKKDVPLTRQIERITRLLGRMVDKIHDSLTLRTRRVIVTVSTGDAAKTALLYGAVSAALAGLIEFLDRSLVRVKTRGRDEINVRADFVSEKSKAEIDLVLYARVAGMLRVLFAFLTSGIQKKSKPKKGAKPTLPVAAEPEELTEKKE